MSTLPGASAPNIPARKTNLEPPARPRCAHARVQIVARQEDTEFVECLECREIFESSEFQDMAIEEKIDESPEE